jgi:hypothetical protein
MAWLVHTGSSLMGGCKATFRACSTEDKEPTGRASRKAQVRPRSGGGPSCCRTCPEEGGVVPGKKTVQVQPCKIMANLNHVILDFQNTPMQYYSLMHFVIYPIIKLPPVFASKSGSVGLQTGAAAQFCWIVSEMTRSVEVCILSRKEHHHAHACRN